MSGRYQAFITSDGMKILVGNKDRDNDYLHIQSSFSAGFLVACGRQFRGACNCT